MHVIELESVDSTNSQVKRLWEGRAPGGEPLLVMAAEQTAGRGRLGRKWESARGGAWFSLGWQTQRQVGYYHPAPLLAGLAVKRGIEHAAVEEYGQPTTAGEVEIKWPNDVLLWERKVAGVLCEWQEALLVVGVGINVNNAVAGLGDGWRYPATSLAEAWGRPVEVRELIERVAAEIAAGLVELESEGFTEKKRREVEQGLAWMGQTVSVKTAQGGMTGVLAGLEEDGALRLATDRGVQVVHAGEIEGLRPRETEGKK
ncbi:MAG: biotin--[acetyl-CoA-carboxylase] ligase [Phycisphaeraceae bacterium]|nr:biotin--[acetyl-CoA-carboxylase] ligase [Phycisphaeraceae bacterium]